MTISLSRCAENAKNSIALAKKAETDAEARFKEAGKWLIQAREMLGLGSRGWKANIKTRANTTFAKWVTENVGISVKTAYRYIAIASDGRAYTKMRKAGQKRNENDRHVLKEARSIVTDLGPAENADPEFKIKRAVISSITSKLWKMSLTELEDIDREI